MVMSSTQVAGIIGGQQAAFSNQMAYASQIGPGGQQTAGMQNPYPASSSYGLAGFDPSMSHLGGNIAGGAIAAAPAAVGMMGMMGMGGAMGLLDPTTGITRAFGAATGSPALNMMRTGGSGMLGGLSAGIENVGGAFASGGMRAGMGMLGRGLGAAAAVGGVYMAAGQAAGEIGSQMYQGVQNFQDVSRMTNKYFENQTGSAGSGLGGRPSHGMIKNITATLHEFASEDVMSSMKEMRALMDKAGQMGMLAGVGNADQFKQKMKGIVQQTRAIAAVMGTTLEEAAPLVKQYQQMGVWGAKDVMGSAITGMASGPGGHQALMNTMSQGSQMAHAMGGSMGAGARTASALFSRVGAARGAGALTEEQLMDYTGGVGGVEGQSMAASGIQSVIARMGQTAGGRLMMAGLAEVKDGKLTGKMDQGLLDKFNKGETSIGALAASGKGRLGNKSMAADFFNKQGKLSQNLGEQGGLEAMDVLVKKAMQKQGLDTEDDALYNMTLKIVTQAGQQEADLIQNLIKNAGKTREEERRRTSAVLADKRRQLEIRKYRSVEGAGNAISHAYEEKIGRPLQEMGESLVSRTSEAVSDANNWLTGTSAPIKQLGEEQRQSLINAGALSSKGATVDTAGALQDSLKGSGISNFIGNIGKGNNLAKMVGAAGAGMVAGGVVGGFMGSLAMPLVGTAIGGLAGSTITGLSAAATFAGTLTGGNDEIDKLLGAGLVTRTGTKGDNDVDLGGGRFASVTEVAKTQREMNSRAQDAINPNKADSATQKKVDAAIDQYHSFLGKAENREWIKKIKEEDPANAARLIAEKAGINDQSILAKVIGQLKLGGSGLAPDMATSTIPDDMPSKAIDDEKTKLLSEMSDLSGGSDSDKLTKGEFNELMTNKSFSPQDLIDSMGSGAAAGKAAINLSKSTEGGKFLKNAGKMSAEDKESYTKKIQRWGSLESQKLKNEFKGATGHSRDDIEGMMTDKNNPIAQEFVNNLSSIGGLKEGDAKSFRKKFGSLLDGSPNSAAINDQLAKEGGKVDKNNISSIRSLLTGAAEGKAVSKGASAKDEANKQYIDAHAGFVVAVDKFAAAQKGESTGMLGWFGREEPKESTKTPEKGR